MKRDNIQKGNKSLNYRDDFEAVYDIIENHRSRVANVVNNESLIMVWEVGGFVSNRLKSSAWGDGVVRMLAEYIHTRNPKAKGWSYRTLYKMVQLYETYSATSFSDILNRYGMQQYLQEPSAEIPLDKKREIVPFEMAQNRNSEIVPFETAQIPNVLFCTGWTNHQIIMNRCRSNEERLFYMLYAGREKLQNKELTRAISTNSMSSILGSKDAMSLAMSNKYPSSPLLFKDRVYLDMLGLPHEYKESKLRKKIVSHMKDFILELGKDFLFIDEEHRVAVGSKTFKVDLLFYHRLLQCMVAIELKTTEFHPKDLGQLEFYLEALDQEERRSNENPSIGIILCKEADMEVVRYALNRSMSPTMVALYKEQLQVGGIIQRSLVEFCKFISEDK